MNSNYILSDLYRKEAFDSRIKGFSNPVSIKGSLAVSAMLMGIFLFTAGLIVFGLATDYTRRAVVGGYLWPEAGSISIISPKSGQLFVEVADGSEVDKGQRIARIHHSETDANGQSLLDLEIDNLMQSQTFLQSRLSLIESRVPVQNALAEISLDQHKGKIALAQILLETRTEEVSLSSETLERAQQLSELGLSSRTELASAEQHMILAQQAQSEAESSVALLQTSLREIELDWDFQNIELQQSINILMREQSSLASQLLQRRAEQEAGVFAPISGALTYSTAQDGELVNTDAQLFQITPSSSDFVANLLAPSSAVGFVEVGDIIQIRYDAFPYREHGVFSGEITSIDSTAQLSSSIDAPIQIAGPVYRITAKIDQGPISKSTEPLRLVSGMVFEASIIIDEKPLLLWLLSPVL